MALDSTYLQVSDGTGDASLMHITSIRSAGATTIAVDTLVGVPSKFIASSGTVLPTGLMDPTTVTNFYGQISGSALQINGFLPGSTDAGNTAGQIVVIKPNTAWANFVAGAVTTPRLKPTTGYGQDTNAGDHSTTSITGVPLVTVLTYTAGVTNERLFIDVGIGFYVSANAGIIYLLAAGTGVTLREQSIARTTSASVVSATIQGVVDVNAGQTATVTINGYIAVSGTLTLRNSSGQGNDGYNMRYVAFGNN